MNECLDVALNRCDDNAECDNTPGSYSCRCRTGFRGSGFSCTGAFPLRLLSQLKQCVLPHITHTRTHTHTHSVFVPSEIDECVERADACDANAVCSNSASGFSCVCNAGYTGSGFTCAGPCTAKPEVDAVKLPGSLSLVLSLSPSRLSLFSKPHRSCLLPSASPSPLY